MSYSFCGTAVKSNIEELVEALSEFAAERNGEFKELHDVSSKEKGCLDFQLMEFGEWTVMAWLHPQTLIPEIVRGISKICSTPVISVDQLESSGYEHFSWLESGKEYMVFTSYGDVLEEIGIDYEALKAKAIERKLSIPRGLKENDYCMHAFDWFNNAFSPLNVEEATLRILDGEESTAYRLTLPGIEELAMGVTEEQFWNVLRKKKYEPTFAPINLPSKHVPVDAHALGHSKFYFALHGNHESTDARLTANAVGALDALCSHASQHPDERRTESGKLETDFDKVLDHFFRCVWSDETPISKTQLASMLTERGVSSASADAIVTEYVRHVARRLLIMAEKENRDSESVAYCDLSLQLDPKAAYAYESRGRAWLALNEFQRAVDDFNRVVEMEGPEYFLCLYRAQAYAALGEAEKAKSDKKLAKKLSAAQS